MNQLPNSRVQLVREAGTDYTTKIKINGPEVLARLLAERYALEPAEVFDVVLLNTASHVIDVVQISRGGIAASIVEPRAVFQAAILANAASIILAHNHPSGNPEPSAQDLSITKRLVEGGTILGIPVHDHMIVCGEQWNSLARSGQM